MSFKSLNQCWATLVIEELVRNGITFFCISPGSRSTPLTLAVADNKKAETNIFHDERNAAWFAQGYARSAGKPAVLICTSGTAGANYYPAVIEAYMEEIPLIVLTADRPPELQNTGANQTIDQENLFGKYTRWFRNFNPPSYNLKPDNLLKKIDKAVQFSCGCPGGPVHLNFMFREPLVPIKTDFDYSYIDSLKKWSTELIPFGTSKLSKLKSDQRSFEKIMTLINKSRRGILVVGRLRNSKESKAVRHLAKKLNWPIWADIQSGLRIGMPTNNLIQNFDHLLTNKSFAENLNPDLILHFGGSVISKRFLEFVEKYTGKYVMINSFSRTIDPCHKVNLKLTGNLTEICADLVDAYKGNPSDILGFCRNRSDILNSRLKKIITFNKAISEPGLAQMVSRLVPDGQGLYLGNSMPVRDMDWYSDPNGPVIMPAANRGASGIDGVLSSACGFAAGLKKPVTLLIGDLSLIHNLNALHTASESNVPVIIVVINNSGGAIFNFLPVVNERRAFTKFFSTPHELGFKSAAEMFKISYSNPITSTGFSRAYKKALKSGSSMLIEVNTDKAENLKLHKQLLNAAKQVI